VNKWVTSKRRKGEKLEKLNKCMSGDFLAPRLRLTTKRRDCSPKNSGIWKDWLSFKDYSRGSEQERSIELGEVKRGRDRKDKGEN